MYELSVEQHFSAAHHLHDYPGNCARWHGHNWTVTVHFRAAALDPVGMAVDFRDLKECLRRVLGRFDHTNLNQLPEFAERNPTCEVLAHIIYQDISRDLHQDGVTVGRVTVAETPGTSASYFE